MFRSFLSLYLLSLHSTLYFFETTAFKFENFFCCSVYALNDVPIHISKFKTISSYNAIHKNVFNTLRSFTISCKSCLNLKINLNQVIWLRTCPIYGVHLLIPFPFITEKVTSILSSLFNILGEFSSNKYGQLILYSLMQINVSNVITRYSY